MPDNPTGESPASHEGTYLEPDERDDEVLTMTRRDLRMLVHELVGLMLLPAERRLDKALENYVRLDTITPEEIADERPQRTDATTGRGGEAATTTGAAGRVRPRGSDAFTETNTARSTRGQYRSRHRSQAVHRADHAPACGAQFHHEGVSGCE